MAIKASVGTEAVACNSDPWGILREGHQAGHPHFQPDLGVAVEEIVKKRACPFAHHGWPSK